MPTSPAIEVDALTHHYGDRCALDQLQFQVDQGEVFVFLGPNGGGKTTLFRILSTLIMPQQGTVRVLGRDLPGEIQTIRQRIGVVFQAASLDKKLTVAENLWHQGHLYGLGGRGLAARRDELLQRFRLSDRASDRVETLSGGLRRRVELAKGLLHAPQLLLLDEPSTGLDPGARGDLWEYLHLVQREDGTTIVMTTHLLEEADKADRIAILDQGKLVALDTPDRLRSTVGGDAITIETEQPAELAAAIGQKFDCTASVLDDSVRLERPDGHQWIARLVEAFPGQIDSIKLGKPSLEDVFIDRCGRRLDDTE